SSILDYLNKVVSDRKVRLIACGSCRRLAPLLSGDEYLRVIEVAEGYADGEQSKASLRRNRKAIDQCMFEMINAKKGSNSKEWNCYILGRLAVSEKEFRAFGKFLSDIGKSGWNELLNGVVTETPLIARDIAGDPFHSVSFESNHRSSAVLALANQM